MLVGWLILGPCEDLKSPKVPIRIEKKTIKKTRTILPRGDISHVPMRTKAILSLGVGFRVTMSVRVRS